MYVYESCNIKNSLEGSNSFVLTAEDWGRGCGSSIVVECLSNKHKALDLVLISEDKKEQNKKKLPKKKKKVSWKTEIQ